MTSSNTYTKPCNTLLILSTRIKLTYLLINCHWSRGFTCTSALEKAAEVRRMFPLFLAIHYKNTHTHTIQQKASLSQAQVTSCNWCHTSQHSCSNWRKYHVIYTISSILSDVSTCKISTDMKYYFRNYVYCIFSVAELQEVNWHTIRSQKHISHMKIELNLTQKKRKEKRKPHIHTDIAPLIWHDLYWMYFQWIQKSPHWFCAKHFS